MILERRRKGGGREGEERREGGREGEGREKGENRRGEGGGREGGRSMGVIVCPVTYLAMGFEIGEERHTITNCVELINTQRYLCPKCMY